MKTSSKLASVPQTDNDRASQQAEVTKLAARIAAYAPHDGTFDLHIPGLHVSRFSRINPVRSHVLQLPALCLITRGAKSVAVGQEVYEYDCTRMLVFSVALPVAAQVTKAAHADPYLALRLDFDPLKISELVLKVFPNGLPPVTDRKAVYVSPIDPGIVNAAARLMECLPQPADIELLAPLVKEEILIRLLRSPVGSRIAEMGFAESSLQRIARAIAWLRENFSQPMKVEELAELVHMSPSSFHEHFKSVTSLSPLQYQKVLRLQEARRLMLSATLDASSAGQRVGYLSASQFSREYSRFFGSAPTKDIASLRSVTSVSA
jgi:AraC-like DNA-binding protein